MTSSLERFIRAYRLAAKVAGSPIALLIMVASSLISRGFRETLDSTARLLSNPSANSKAIGRDEHFKIDREFTQLWQAQKAHSRQLAMSRPNSRVGQSIYSVQESAVGVWTRQNLKGLIDFNPDLIFLMEDESLGGNERFTEAIIAETALSQPHTRVLVIRTSGVGEEARRSEQSLEVFLTNLNDAQKLHVIEMLLDNLNVKKLIVANSRLGWTFLTEARLSNFEGVDFYANLFCPDFDYFGREIGFGKTHFPQVAGVLSGILTDNFSYPRDLISDALGVAPLRLPSISKFSIPTRFVTMLNLDDCERNNILWVGRLVSQKGFRALRHIAKVNQGLDFHIFFHGSGPRASRFTKSLSSNAHSRGSFSELEELTGLRGAIYLNTSLWDGLPNTLLEMVSAGMPVITTELPGIREFLTENPKLPIFFIESLNQRDFLRALAQAKDWLKLDAEHRRAEIEQFSKKRANELEAQVAEFIRGVRDA